MNKIERDQLKLSISKEINRGICLMLLEDQIAENVIDICEHHPALTKNFVYHEEMVVQFLANKGASIRNSGENSCLIEIPNFYIAEFEGKSASGLNMPELFQNMFRIGMFKMKR